MATEAYYRWVARGRPWRLARPIDELQTWANRNGVRVMGTIGNEDHLQADRPQDHTPFSFTEWPVALAGDIVCAIDLANVRGLGPAIERQARAGKLPWLKYMNHSGRHLDSRDLDGDGKTWEVYPSGDEHVHLSIRTDWAFRSIGNFNPWEEDDMSEQAEREIHSVFTGMFNGGSSMGRAVDPDGAGAAPATNSLVAKFDYTLRRVDELAGKVDALAARPPAAISQAMLETALRNVLGSLDGAAVARLAGREAGR